MKKKIFGIGLPRTGTTSLNYALEELGIKSFHFPFEFWEKGDFSALEEYDAFTDTPVFAMVEQLAKRCPDSRFILTTREKEGWLKSMEWLLSEGPKIWPWRAEYNRFNEEYFGSPRFNYQLYGDAYDQYHDEVMRWLKLSKNRFLVLDLDQGYGYDELCGFLSKEKPARPYPRGNSKRKAGYWNRLYVKLYHFNPRLARAANRLKEIVRSI